MTLGFTGRQVDFSDPNVLPFGRRFAYCAAAWIVALVTTSTLIL